MPMTYAGFPLTLMTEFLFPRFQRWWEENAPDLWSYPGYALEGMHHLPVPDRPKTPTKARLNTLYWPTGASRWGIFHGLVDNATLTAIQALTGGVTGTPPTPQVLFLQGATGETPVNASMYLLNVRPIFVNGFQNLLWITLVDKRYYYWLKRPTYTFVDGDSWEDLILALSSAAGSPTPTISTIPAAYGTPTFERWNLIGKPLPILMDAAARQVGLRYIISLDGTTADFVNYTTAQANAVLQYELCQVTAPSPRIVLGGRNGPITPPLAPGSVQSLIGNVPANVTVQFWGDTKADYVAVNVSLASLALSEYSGLSGVSGAYGVWMADQKEDVVSPTQSAYATQAATDYYLWLLSLNDFTVTSIFPFESGGLEDRIEWEYCSIRESVSPGAMGAARIGVGIREARETDVGLTAPIRVLTRIVPFDWHDNAIYGGGLPDSGSSPPPPPATVEKPWIVLTETSGPSSWQGRFVDIPSGTWANSPDSGTNDIRPCQIDGGTFLPKPTANALKFSAEWSGDAFSGPAYMPIQYADRVSAVDYPGFVSTSAQTWNGTKTFADSIVVNLDQNVTTVVNVWTTTGFTAQTIFSVSSVHPTVVGESYSGSIALGTGGAPAQISSYGQLSISQSHTQPSDTYVLSLYITDGTEIGTMMFWQDNGGVPKLSLGRSSAGTVDLFCVGTQELGLGSLRATNSVYGGNITGYSYYTIEHVGPFATFTGGTAPDGSGGYIFLNGLYISGGVSGSFP